MKIWGPAVCRKDVMETVFLHYSAVHTLNCGIIVSVFMIEYLSEIGDCF